MNTLPRINSSLRKENYLSRKAVDFVKEKKKCDPDAKFIEQNLAKSLIRHPSHKPVEGFYDHPNVPHLSEQSDALFKGLHHYDEILITKPTSSCLPSSLKASLISLLSIKNTNCFLIDGTS